MILLLIRKTVIGYIMHRGGHAKGEKAELPEVAGRRQGVSVGTST